MRPTQARTGLTIIEVLIALVVFVIVFIVLANSQLLSIRVTTDSRLASEATQEANDVLEMMMRDILRYREDGPDVDGDGDADSYFFIEAYYDCDDGVTTVATSPGTEPASVLCELSGSLDNGTAYTATVRGLPVVTSADYTNEGIVELVVHIAKDEGRELFDFTSYVSCYDVASALTLADGRPCPEPVVLPDPSSA